MYWFIFSIPKMKHNVLTDVNSYVRRGFEYVMSFLIFVSKYNECREFSRFEIKYVSLKLNFC